MQGRERIFGALKILLVEDDPDVARELQTFLGYRFGKAFLAQDGTEALELYHHTAPDIVITDIQLPGMDGLTLVEEIRRVNRRVPIFVITAHVYEEYLLRAVKLGLEDFIPKPIIYSQLLSALKQCAHKLNTRERTLDTAGKVRYSYRNKALYQEDRRISLTHMEITLLELLLDRSTQVVTYDQIAATLYPNTPMSRDSLRSLVRRLRGKLSGLTIKNIPDVGYRLDLSN